MSNLSKWGGNINLTPHEKDVKKQQQQAQQQQPQQPHSATTTPSPHNPNFELPRGVMDITDLQQLKKNAEQQGKKVKLLHPWFPMAALSSVVLGAWLYYACTSFRCYVYITTVYRISCIDRLISHLHVFVTMFFITSNQVLYSTL